MYRQFMAFAAVCVFLTGCVSLPVKSPTKDMQENELVRDVRFLSQPALKGRKAGSWESAAVRRFLVQRFEQYRLIPWAGCEGYEQKFRFGTNVIGVLPGSDPNLADQMVLISAHYDHLGVQKWKTCPGAYDNATAVAVLLEIAEQLSLRAARPKRPVCFAAFDAEEMGCLGSFAFTCREDYDDSKIAAVINMDLLGRDLLDVVDHSLFVTGTENFARLENEVSAACSQNNLKFIPLGSDLIGPVGDHIAFTSSRRPVLFFTCGINKDYHQPTDTADKVNFSKLKQEGVVVEQTLLALANADSGLLKREPSPITRQTADSFIYMLAKIRENRNILKIDPDDIKIVDEIIAKVKRCDPNVMTPDQLHSLERESLGKLLPLLENYNKTLAQYSSLFVEISKLYAINPEELTRIYRQMVLHYLTRKLSLFRSNDFCYCGSLPFTEKNWGLAKIKDDEYFFGFFDAEISIQCSVSIFAGSSFQGGLHYKLTALKGPFRSILDAALVGKPGEPNGFHGIIYGQYGPADQKPGPDAPNNLTWRQRDLWKAMGTAVSRAYPDEIASLKNHPCQDPNWLTLDWYAKTQLDKDAWSIFLMPQDIAKPDKPNKAEQEHRFIQVVKDSSRHVESRSDAIAFLVSRKTKTSLTAVADIIDDPTPFKTEITLVYENDYPLRYHPIVSGFVSKKEEKGNKYKDKTLGQIAMEKLKKVTKKDFGSDKEAWKQWIKRHY